MTIQSAAPLVGIVACRKEIGPHWFHAVGEKYVAAVRDGAGALPVLLPASGAAAVDPLLDILHGVFLSGSLSNVNPDHYGGRAAPPETLQDTHRDATTLPLVPRVLARGMPLLAVCRGLQEMNVALGGTLHQAVHEVAGMQDHRSDESCPLEEQYGTAHRVNLTPGGLLAVLAGSNEAMVNSLHEQGIDRLAPGLDVLAEADDGLIEAFGVSDAAGFALAVQWHPEWRLECDRLSMAIFQAFGAACRRYAASAWKQGGDAK